MWNAQDASYGPPASSALQEWATKHGERRYALQVAQHPARARMCGFGDKDRRPLAPAAIAKLVVLDKDDQPIPPESIQAAFFIVLVDLWDETGQHDINLVKVPLPTSITSRRLKVQRAEQSPESQRQNGTAYAFSDPQTSSGYAANEATAQHTSSPTHARTSSTGSNLKRKRGIKQASNDEEVPTQPFYSDDTNYPAPYAPELVGFAPFPPYSLLTSGTTMPQADGLAYFTMNNVLPGVPDGQTYHPAVGVDEQPYLGTSQPSPGDESLESVRTLIGPLAAGAQTLNDDNDEPGIFFLFQDLSVRTEGNFRLRMRLVNVGAPPAPEPGATSVRSDSSSVLAQVFTEVFTVFSPKKFPGVPSPTPLSQRLLQQGFKIPGRSRHPNVKSTSNGSARKKRRKTDGDEWAAANGTNSNSDDD